MDEEEIMFAFMNYLDLALIDFEENVYKSNNERVKVYYGAYKESVLSLINKKEER